MIVAREALPKLTDRLPLGSQGLQVSPACLGITIDPAVVPAAFEAGINFFFITADMHWPVYRDTRLGLQQLLRDKPSARDDIVVAVVAYVTQPEFVWVPFEEVLMEVPELKRIDITIAGGCYGYEIGRRIPMFEAHRTRKHVGVRAIGASFHDREAARAEIERASLDLAYVRYNPPHPKAREQLFQRVPSRADGRRTLIFNFKSTEGYLDKAQLTKLGVSDSFWEPHITDYYRFAFTEPNVDGVLCALPHAQAVRELSDALARGPLDDDDHQYLIDLGDLAMGRAKLDP